MRAEETGRHLVLFARRPALGAGKRRLAAAIGELAALRFQRFAFERLVRTLGGDPRWTLWLCLTPDRPAKQRQRYEVPQGRGDLGQRLSRLMRQLPPGPIVVIGSDAPQIARRYCTRLSRTWARLRGFWSRTGRRLLACRTGRAIAPAPAIQRCSLVQRAHTS
jgi:glycosyltransferase A (GT-A) superfamily protein (DUF2064 family)